MFYKHQALTTSKRMACSMKNNGGQTLVHSESANLLNVQKQIHNSSQNLKNTTIMQSNASTCLMSYDIIATIFNNAHENLY